MLRVTDSREVVYSRISSTHYRSKIRTMFFYETITCGFSKSSRREKELELFCSLAFLDVYILCKPAQAELVKL